MATRASSPAAGSRMSKLARSVIISQYHHKKFDGNGAEIGGGSGGIGSLIVPWLMEEKRHTSSTVLCRNGRSVHLHTCLAVDIASMVNIARSDISVSEEAKYGGCKVAGDRVNPMVTSIHASGILADAIINNQTVGSLRKTAAPKVISVLKSSPAFMDAISRCILFSSIATMLGSPGQSNYAAANGALDAWSIATRDEGSPVVSIQWGAWHGAGMGGMAALDPGRMFSKLKQLGFGLLTPNLGISALSDIMDEISACVPVILVSPFDPARFLKVSSLDSPMFPLFEYIIGDTNSCEDIRSKNSKLYSSGPVVLLTNNAPEIKDIALKAASEILMKQPPSDMSLVNAGIDSLSAI